MSIESRLQDLSDGGSLKFLTLVRTPDRRFQASYDCGDGSCRVHVADSPVDAVDYVLAETLGERLAVSGRSRMQDDIDLGLD